MNLLAEKERCERVMITKPLIANRRAFGLARMIGVALLGGMLMTGSAFACSLLAGPEDKARESDVVVEGVTVCNENGSGCTIKVTKFVKGGAGDRRKEMTVKTKPWEDGWWDCDVGKVPFVIEGRGRFYLNYGPDKDSYFASHLPDLTDRKRDNLFG